MTRCLFESVQPEMSRMASWTSSRSVQLLSPELVSLERLFGLLKLIECDPSAQNQSKSEHNVQFKENE